MSGHSKWSTIKRKKGAIDSKRGKIFSKIIKEISISVKEGGSDPDGNPRLRLAINNAKGANMPKDNVLRAINKASDKDSASIQETTYECYSNGGVAIFIEALTDNLQRTLANIRSYLNKFSGNLGTNGSLAFVFTRKGIFNVAQGNWTEDDFTMEVIDAGAEDVSLEDAYFQITTSFEDFGKMQRKLEELKVELQSANLERVPLTTTKLDVESAKKALRLIELIEDDDDIQNVYHNLEMTDELMAELNK